MKLIKLFSVEDLDIILINLDARNEKFPNEDFRTALGVVLFNYGSGLVKVVCVGSEKWTATKADLPPRKGVPLCPNGHPLLEMSEAPKLALIDLEN